MLVRVRDESHRYQTQGEVLLLEDLMDLTRQYLSQYGHIKEATDHLIVDVLWCGMWFNIYTLKEGKRQTYGDCYEKLKRFPINYDQRYLAARKWCQDHGWTHLQYQNKQFWAIPPQAFIPQPIPSSEINPEPLAFLENHNLLIFDPSPYTARSLLKIFLLALTFITAVIVLSLLFAYLPKSYYIKIAILAFIFHSIMAWILKSFDDANQ